MCLTILNFWIHNQLTSTHYHHIGADLYTDFIYVCLIVFVTPVNYSDFEVAWKVSRHQYYIHNLHFNISSLPNDHFFDNGTAFLNFQIWIGQFIVILFIRRTIP